MYWFWTELRENKVKGFVFELKKLSTTKLIEELVLRNAH